MPWHLRKWPNAVYPKEAEEIPEAKEDIDVALFRLATIGPSLEEYGAKCLGKGQDGLWQLGFKVHKKRVRILYAPYGNTIVVYRIHPKTSPQEQERAYELAKKRKKEAERLMKEAGDPSEGLPPITLH